VLSTILRPLTADRTPLILGLVALFILFDLISATRAVRDLASRVALVTEDVLETTSGTGRGYSARFTRLGRMSITARARVEAMPRERHRVVYSPRTKVVWEVERLDRQPHE
jgi:hypothetical protein